MRAVKPLFWIAGSLRDLRGFPERVKRMMGFALWQAQTGVKHVAAKPLKGFGSAAVLEIVEDDDGNTYRGVYTVKFSGVVYVLHAFQKKSKRGVKTPQKEIDLIHQRLKSAEEYFKRWRASQQEDSK